MDSNRQGIEDRASEQTAFSECWTGWSKLPPTTSSLASWSWRDVAVSLAGAMLGALAGIALSAWLAPDLYRHPYYVVRFAQAARVLLLWGVPLTAGLCLAAGQPRRAWRIWLRHAGRAVLLAAIGAVATAALAVMPLPGFLVSPRAPFAPLAAWPLLGLVVGAACAMAFPAERHRGQSMGAGLLAGLIIGIRFPHLAGLADGLHGVSARLVAHMAVLLSAGIALGLITALVREVGKSRWLLVVFGDDPGRHYPIYQTPLTLGTDSEHTLTLDPTGQVQPHHAVIRIAKGRTRLEPSTPASLVFLRNRILDVSDLYDGDELQIGETVLRYYEVQ